MKQNITQLEDIIDIKPSGVQFTGWPTLTKTQSGELLAVYSGCRHHADPFGQVHLIRSRDGGATWTWPRVLADGILDDRDSGILQTRNGTLIVNWFSSLIWEWLMENSEPGSMPKDFSEAEQAEWQRRRALLTDEIRAQELGLWSIRSTDGGVTWSQKIPTLVNSPHGPCELSDGRLLFAGNRRFDDISQTRRGSPFWPGKAGAAQSTDDGQSWQFIGEIPVAPEQNEFHAAEAADGSIIVHIRVNQDPHKSEVLQTESHDGGYTWSVPHPTGLWGYPAFLLKMQDDRLLTTFGHRREPFGNQISISEDNGKNWSPQVAINTDSGTDMGYPSTVELEPGRFATLWYDFKDSDTAYLRLARWRLG